MTMKVPLVASAWIRLRRSMSAAGRDAIETGRRTCW
jgi:hypothetical protein